MSTQTENAAQGHVVKDDAYRANRIRVALAELQAAVKEAEAAGITVDITWRAGLGYEKVSIVRTLWQKD